MHWWKEKRYRVLKEIDFGSWKHTKSIASRRNRTKITFESARRSQTTENYISYVIGIIDSAIIECESGATISSLKFLRGALASNSSTSAITPFTSVERNASNECDKPSSVEQYLRIPRLTFT